MTSNTNGRLERRQRFLLLYGTTVWPSFLVAVFASIVFFGNIDPATLHVQTMPQWNISRLGGYTIGFFMFWGVGLASSLLCMTLQRLGDRTT